MGRKRHMATMVHSCSVSLSRHFLRLLLLLLLLLLVVVLSPPQGPLSGSCGCHAKTIPHLILPHQGKYLRTVASYTAMMGLAIQSHQWKSSMQNELVLLAKSMAEATTWQDAAGADEAEAKALEEKALEEKVQGQAMQQEAQAWMVQGRQDESQATAMSQEAEGLHVHASQEKQESVELLAQAAAEEATEEEDMAKATADAASVAKNAADVEADEAGTVLCQWIPIVDVVCDVVGGAVAVGLGTQSVAETSVVTEEYASAMALQSRVDSLTKEAEGLEGVSVQEGEEASVLQEKAAKMDALAEEELAKGEAQEVAAKEELAQSSVDKEMGTEKEAMGLTKEEESERSWNESLQHGAKACGKALMMCITSVVAFVFWMMRIVGSVVAVAVGSIGGGVVMGMRGNGSGCRWSIHRHASIVHYVLLAMLCFGIRGKDFLQLQNVTEISVMGGTVLGFSWNLATVQTLCLYSLPKVYQVYHQQQQQQQRQQQETIGWSTLGSLLWVAMYEYGRVMLVLLPFTVMEVLLIWVNFGKWVFVPKVVQWVHDWLWLWGTLWFVAAVMYYRCIVGVPCEEMSSHDDSNHGKLESSSSSPPPPPPPQLSFQFLLNRSTERGVNDRVVMDYGARGSTKSSSSSNCSSSSSSSSYSGRDTERNALQHLDEEVPLLGKANNEKQDPNLLDEQSTSTSGNNYYNEVVETEAVFIKEDIESQNNSFLTLVMEDASRLHLVLVFEILMASVMLAFLNQSTHVVKHLWPASKAILLKVYPHFHVMAGAILAVSVFLLMCAFL